MEIGQIVFCKNLKFKDGFYDKKINRPCINLGNLSEQSVCICPLTSQLTSINKHPASYYLIPEVIFKYKKLSFAHLQCLLIYDINALIETNRILTLNTMNQLYDRIIQKYQNNSEYNNILEMIKQNQELELKISKDKCKSLKL